MFWKKQEKYLIDPLYDSYIYQEKEHFINLQFSVYKTKENCFVDMSDQELYQNLNVKFVPCLKFAKKEDLSTVLFRTKRVLQQEEVQKKNKWMCALYERQIKRDVSSLIYLRWINSLVGYGIFAKKNLSSLTFIGEYLGLVKKRTSYRDFDNNYIFGYPIGPKNTRFVIDARHIGGLTRFINHSDEPNLSCTWMIVDGLPRVVFHTNQLVLKDTQLTYDYGPNYWKHRTPPFHL